jgi:hypothetical protein
MSGAIVAPIQGQTMNRDSTIQIDPTHCRAICEEIGERLRIMLDREAMALPPRLQVLMLRLAAQDLAGSPSIAAAIDESMAA